MHNCNDHRFEDRYRLPLGVSVNFQSYAAKLLTECAYDPSALGLLQQFGKTVRAPLSKTLTEFSSMHVLEISSFLSGDLPGCFLGHKSVQMHQAAA